MERTTGNAVSGFFCMELVSYLNEEAEMGTEFYEVLWHERFAQAKAINHHIITI